MGACRTCLIFITIQLVSLASAQSMEKRGPQGFLGMRGKKFIEDEDVEQFYKRKPQFFVGVKGKKSLQDILESGDDLNKRAPMGFMGMRGKKEEFFPDFQSEYVPKRDGSLIGQIDFSSNDQNNQDTGPVFNEILSQFMEKMGRYYRTTAPGKVETEAGETEQPYDTNELDKRAANIHQFFGVRGKKSLNNKRPYDLSFRGKFIGVRGKKDMKSNGLHEIKYLLGSPLPKRKSQMGFFGMRGKKWIDANESSMEMEPSN